MITRRAFIGTAAGGLLPAPFAAGAQQSTNVPRVAVLVPGKSPAGTGLSGQGLQAFRDGLRALGYVEGQNIELDVRFEEGKPERWPGIVDELMRRRVDVMMSAAWAATLAVRKGAPGVPLVDATMVDPVGQGFAASLARPGGNLTGLTLISGELAAKRLQLIKDAIPGLSRVAVLAVAGNPSVRPQIEASEVAARSLGLRLDLIEVSTVTDVEAAIERAARSRVGALAMFQGSLFGTNRATIASWALKR